MRVNIYYGGRGLIDDPTLYTLEKITKVLEELQVTVERYNLYEEKSSITVLPKTLKGADGVILAASVEWLGIGGLLQQFLDACWLYGDKECISHLYMLPVVMATTYGEREVEYFLIRAWEMLGGIPSEGLCAYVDNHVEFETNASYHLLIEKKTENFYRTISKRMTSFPNSNMQVKKTVLRSNTLTLTPQESEQLSVYASDDNYVKQQKEDIEELASLFKGMLGEIDEPKKDTSQENLVSQTGISGQGMSSGQVRTPGQAKALGQMTATMQGNAAGQTRTPGQGTLSGQAKALDQMTVTMQGNAVGQTRISGQGTSSGQTRISGQGTSSGQARALDQMTATMQGNAVGQTRISGQGMSSGQARTSDQAKASVQPRTPAQRTVSGQVRTSDQAKASAQPRTPAQRTVSGQVRTSDQAKASAQPRTPTQRTVSGQMTAATPGKDRYTARLINNFSPMPGMTAVFQIDFTDVAKTLLVDINEDKINCYHQSAQEIGKTADVIAKVSSAVFDSIVSGKSTFQSAFMSGELSAQGNFKILRNFDTMFRF